MFIFLNATPHFYTGLNAGISYIKRKLTLDKDFKDTNPQTDNSKFHFSGSLHLGITLPAKEKFFIGLEGFAGRSFGADYFKPQMNFGAKAIAGLNISEKIRLYAGAGADFMRIKSLKIGLDNKNYNLYKWEEGQHPLDFSTFPLFLGNLGVEFFIMKKLSLRLDGQFLIGGNKNFSKTRIGTKMHDKLSDKSSEKYHSLKAMFGLFYHGGF